jgi:uncharacterized protein (DUF1501 family)
MAQTRRQFLVHTGCGALSAAALLSGLGRFALIDALAQSVPGDYKALVCVFLFGGNDANNVVIPYTNYSDYNSVRSGAQFAIPQGDLKQINPPSTPGLTFGLNPKLDDAFMTNPSLFGLWNQQNMAVVCNTGPLIRPLTRDEYRAGLARPYQLFSHSDQQNLWQTSYANSARQTGWGGLTADKTGGSGGNFPAISSIAGVTVFSTGQNTRPLVLSPAPTTLGQSLRLLRTNDQQAIIDALTADGQDPMPALIGGAAQITRNALDVSTALGNSDPPLTTAFPNTSLGNQLKQVAKVISFIKNTPSLGVNRQIFFASLGGFDTHTGQGQFGTNNGQLGLLSQVSQAIGSLYAATVELNFQNQVTIFTSSDFSRTFVPGGGSTGTDHAWGSHQFVIGGAVIGGDFYGQYPALVLGDGLDTDAGSGARGRWIPTTSVDQYAATLANWYGLAQSDRTLVFPNIGNFSPQTLDFMTVGTGPAQARRRTARS